MISAKRFFRVDVKSAEDGSFSGILSTYGNVDMVGDICEHGCFDATIGRKGTHFPLLWNHNSDEPIGSFDVIGTDVNLSIQGKFNLGVSRAKDIHALVKAGDINGLSIGYLPKKFTWDQDGIRHLTEVELFEGSVTPFPANPLALAEAKKMDENIAMFRKSLVQTLKSLGKSDDEINKIVDETERRCKEDGQVVEDIKEKSEVPKDDETLTKEEIAQLKQLCKDLAEEREKLEEMKK